MNGEERGADNDGIAEIDRSLGGGGVPGKVEHGGFWQATGKDLTMLTRKWYRVVR